MLNKIAVFVLKLYMYIHEIVHKRIVSRLGCLIYDVHPKDYFGKRYEFFNSHVSRNDVIIDVACGTGTILYKIKDRIKFGVGIDYSDSQIELCNKLHLADNLNYIKINVFDTDYKYIKNKLKYNIAIFSHILEHIDDVPGILRMVDAEKILICVPSEDHWYRILMKESGLDISTDRSHYKEYNKTVLLSELSIARYHSIYMEYNSDGDIVCCAIKIK